MNEELLCQIALTMVPNIGAVQARLLVEKFEKASAVFRAKKSDLAAVENIGTARAKNIKDFNDFTKAEDEIAFIEKFKVQPLFYSHKAYPQRLLHCYDAPLLLFYRGNADLNQSKVVSIIGTRSNSDYGKAITEKLVTELKEHNVLVVSGLAYGIDSIAHKSALQNNLATVGVLAHGLKTLYPSQHKSMAKEMLNNGGLLTEFLKDDKPDKHNFPKRNRIVAGIADATIVVETAVKGGSMITAELANNYNRDVFAFPGKITDSKSAGCNYLVKNNKAILLTDAEQLIETMGWQNKPVKRKLTRELFIDLSDDERKIVDVLKICESLHIDELYLKTMLSSSAVAAALLSLELQNIVASLPGKLYKLL